MNLFPILNNLFHWQNNIKILKGSKSRILIIPLQVTLLNIIWLVRNFTAKYLEYIVFNMIKKERRYFYEKSL